MPTEQHTNHTSSAHLSDGVEPRETEPACANPKPSPDRESTNGLERSFTATFAASPDLAAGEGIGAGHHGGEQLSGRGSKMKAVLIDPALRRLVDAKAVGQMLGCSPRTVLRLADARRIPWGVKLGGLRRWDVQEVQNFIASGCVPPGTGVRP
jgi:predicted DNA-binding transcriptional regulator AlpA